MDKTAGLVATADLALRRRGACPWTMASSSVAALDNYRDESRLYSEVSVAGPLTTDAFNGHRAVPAAISSGDLVHDV